MHLCRCSYSHTEYLPTNNHQPNRVKWHLQDLQRVMSLNWKKPNVLLPHLEWEFLWKSANLLLVGFVGIFFSHVCTLYAFLSTILFSDVPCGENLFMSSAPFSWPDVLQTWYNEEKNFEYGIGAKTKGAMFGHYTQVDVFYIYIYLHFRLKK